MQTSLNNMGSVGQWITNSFSQSVSIKFCFQNLKTKNHSEDLGVDGNILYVREIWWDAVD